MILTILILGLFITMAIGTPIAWALGISGLGAVLLMGVPLNTVPQKIFSGMDIFPLMCIPFFVLAGELMAKGGLTRRLLDFAVIMVGHIRGGLSLANVVASMLFGGITGSAIADSSALGSVEIPMMVENGYDPEYSAAVTAASGSVRQKAIDAAAVLGSWCIEACTAEASGAVLVVHTKRWDFPFSSDAKKASTSLAASVSSDKVAPPRCNSHAKLYALEKGWTSEKGKEVCHMSLVLAA